MKPRTEELLYYLLWTADSLMRPTWRNLGSSFDDWARWNGLNRRLGTLAQQKLIERHPEPNLDRVVRLTEAGKRIALGGRDPVKEWARAWDGQWRIVLFDIPIDRSDLRQRLVRALRSRHFGYLQMSAWISPDPTTDVRVALGQSRVQADAFVVLEGRPAAGESDNEIVSSAWDFDVINRRYEQYLTLVRKPPSHAAYALEWSRSENVGWKAALKLDPLLPTSLLPAGYRGRDALLRRKEILSHLANLNQRSMHSDVTGATS